MQQCDPYNPMEFDNDATMIPKENSYTEVLN